MSFEIILPFLRPIATFLQDPDVSEIMVNPGGRVFLEREGQLSEAVGVRLAAYHADSEPVAAYYRQKNLLVSIAAAGAPGDIFAHTLDALAALPPPA